MKSIVEFINEMANDIKHFRKNVEGISKPLIPHLCLCIYCEVYNKENIYYEHWKDEVSGFLKKIISENLKNKADKFEIIKNVIKDNNFLNKEQLIKIIKSKFDKENLNDKKVLDIIAELFITNFDEFIEMIKTSNRENIEDNLEIFLSKFSKYNNEDY